MRHGSAGRALLIAGALLAAADHPARGQTTDPLAAAGSLIAQCAAVDPSAKPACAELSKAVANGHDPAAPLPTVSAILPGDIHIAGPWSAAIVLRHNAAGQWVASAVVGGATAKDIAVTPVASADEAAKLMHGQAAENTVVASVAGGQEAGAMAGTASGWITDAYFSASQDVSKVGENDFARFLDHDVAKLPMGESIDTLPVRPMFVDTTYVRHGYFVSSRPGTYKFSVGFEAAGITAAAPNWECWAQIDIFDGADGHKILPVEPIKFSADTPSARIPTLTSSAVTMPVGLVRIDLTAHCLPATDWKPDQFGFFMQSHGISSVPPNPWPTLILRVQRPNDANFLPIAQDEIVHESANAATLKPAAETHLAATAPGTADPLHALGLPAKFKSGWYIDVYPIVGTDANAWTLPPQSPLQGTFFAGAGGFTLADHRAAGLNDRDGKIYIANSLFLAPEDGRYTFMVVGDNTLPQANGVGICLTELTLTDRSGNPTRMIEASQANLNYLAGPVSLPLPNLGGANLHQGVYKIALRAVCQDSAKADITQAPFANTRYRLFVRTPSENALHPADPGMFVYKTR